MTDYNEQTNAGTDAKQPAQDKHLIPHGMRCFFSDYCDYCDTRNICATHICEIRGYNAGLQYCDAHATEAISDMLHFCRARKMFPLHKIVEIFNDPSITVPRSDGSIENNWKFCTRDLTRDFFTHCEGGPFRLPVKNSNGTITKGIIISELFGHNPTFPTTQKQLEELLDAGLAEYFPLPK